MGLWLGRNECDAAGPSRDAVAGIYSYRFEETLPHGSRTITHVSVPRVVRDRFEIRIGFRLREGFVCGVASILLCELTVDC